MFRILIASLAFIGCVFAESRNENLKYIITRSYLSSPSQAFLEIMASQAISQSNQKIDAKKLVKLFKKECKKEEVLAEFYKSYEGVFSDEEIAELKKIYANPVWQKFSEKGVPIAQTHLMHIKSLFGKLVSQYSSKNNSSGPIKNVTKKNFAALFKSNKPVILEVSATWCSACKAFKPVMEEAAREYASKAVFGHVDFDSQKDLADELDITSLPTVLYFKKGENKPSKRSIGSMDKKEFQEEIDAFLKS